MTAPVSERVHVCVFGRSGCHECRATCTVLDRAGVDYEYVDLDSDPDARRTLKRRGLLGGPVITAGTDAWVGFQPDRILELAESGMAPPAPLVVDPYRWSA
ncbi:glutaredoxin domain-containing protein [Mycobacteroides chelonae]|jgi:glutaredoxin-like protein NrdH|uniref:glutaredoxin domain-containing protein n=1 Tax=Mycobacteroides chelonae TaxID=1774 RepID=UPI000994605F|nr:glutaredoxin domain-containing protein [Mycobacteroides chelonae]